MANAFVYELVCTSCSGQARFTSKTAMIIRFVSPQITFGLWGLKSAHLICIFLLASNFARDYANELSQILHCMLLLFGNP